MSEYFPIFVYFCIVVMVTFLIIALSGLIPSKKKSAVKFMPYESGIQTEAHLLSKRFPLRHYLVALIFLVFDIEIIFMYPWAVIAKEIGPFAFYEMAFFLVAILVGYVYVWRKKGLQWE
jgi:NADH-quinone oxidoreductase subunit A